MGCEVKASAQEGKGQRGQSFEIHRAAQGKGRKIRKENREDEVPAGGEGAAPPHTRRVHGQGGGRHEDTPPHGRERLALGRRLPAVAREGLRRSQQPGALHRLFAGGAAGRGPRPSRLAEAPSVPYRRHLSGEETPALERCSASLHWRSFGMSEMESAAAQAVSVTSRAVSRSQAWTSSQIPRKLQ